MLVGSASYIRATAVGFEDLVLAVEEAEIDAILVTADLIVFTLDLALVVEVSAGLFPVVFHQALAERFLNRTERDGGGAVRQILHRFDAVLLQDPLHAANGITLAVQKPADTLKQVDIVGAIIAPAPAPLHWFDLCEARFPKTQNMLRYVEIRSDLANGSECIRRLVQL